MLKGAHALTECVGGIVLVLVSARAITGLVNTLTQDELIEYPRDSSPRIYWPGRRPLLGHSFEHHEGFASSDYSGASFGPTRLR